MKLPPPAPPLFHISDEDREVARSILATVQAAVLAHGLPAVRKKWNDMSAGIGPVDVLGRPSNIFLISHDFGLELRVRSLAHQNGAEFVLSHAYAVPERRGPKFFASVIPHALELWREVFETVPTCHMRNEAEEVRCQLEALVCGVAVATGKPWDRAYLKLDRKGDLEFEIWRSAQFQPQSPSSTPSSERVRGISSGFEAAIRKAAALSAIHASYFSQVSTGGRLKVQLGPPPSVRVVNQGVLDQLRLLSSLPDDAWLLMT